MVLGFFLRTIVVVVAEDEPKRRRIRPKISDSFQNAQLGAQFPVWNFSELNWAPKSLKNSPIDLCHREYDNIYSFSCAGGGKLKVWRDIRSDIAEKGYSRAATPTDDSGHRQSTETRSSTSIITVEH